MNCWKEINIHKQYGAKRVFIFPATYVFVPRTFYDNHFVLLLIGFWLMFLIHKSFHLLPLLHLGKKVKKSIMLKYRIFPYIQIRINQPIPKGLFLISLITPFFIINTLLLVCCYFFSNYVHYIIILLAYHIGICVSDFICTKNVLSAPNQAYIEETEFGFDILIRH